MKYIDTISRVLLLSGLAYLGFYVYALVMSVFSPGEMVGFSVVALAIVAAYAIHVIRLRRAPDDPPQRAASQRAAEIIRDLHDQRERRGF